MYLVLSALLNKFKERILQASLSALGACSFLLGSYVAASRYYSMDSFLTLPVSSYHISSRFPCKL